jgi:hypothetical protein
MFIYMVFNLEIIVGRYDISRQWSDIEHCKLVALFPWHFLFFLCGPLSYRIDHI